MSNIQNIDSWDCLPRDPRVSGYHIIKRGNVIRVVYWDAEKCVWFNDDHTFFQTIDELNCLTPRYEYVIAMDLFQACNLALGIDSRAPHRRKQTTRVIERRSAGCLICRIIAYIKRLSGLYD